MTEPRRNCGSCIHWNAVDDTCHHAQAADDWGRLKGMANFIPERSYFARRWPQAPGWCGFFNPTEGWLLAAVAATSSAFSKQLKQKEVA